MIAFLFYFVCVFLCREGGERERERRERRREMRGEIRDKTLNSYAFLEGEEFSKKRKKSG